MNDLVVMLATAGRPDLLHRTLASLAECNRPRAYRETVVVENGQQCGAQQIVEQFKRSLKARYLFVPRGNKSFALNCGIDTIGEALVFFTDDDVRFEPGVIEAYWRRGHGMTHGRFFGGPTGVDYETRPPEWLRPYLPVSASGWEWPGPGDVLDQAMLLGFNWAAFATDIRAAGGFDINRGPGSPTGSTGQETDMQRRLLAAGLTGLYVPEAKVWHYIPANRCSPQWALQRNYRQGVEHGRRSAFDRPAVGGLPLWVHRRRLQGALRRAMSRAGTAEQSKFKIEHRKSHLRGLIDGIRQRRAEERGSAVAAAPIATAAAVDGDRTVAAT